jgi:hypothetical protein
MKTTKLIPNATVATILNEIIDNIVRGQIKTLPLPVPAHAQTKDWRKEQPWWKGGKKNECELFQRMQVEQITGKTCPKTTWRINKRTLQMKELSNPMTNHDGFDWTEDFDGEQKNCLGKNGVNYRLLYNFKMVCDAGGAQTRTLREVSEFAEAQLKLLIRENKCNTYFINILDGDQSHLRKSLFNYLLELPDYETVKEKVFISDMYTFKSWYETRF